MSLKTVPDDNLALSVGFCAQTIVIHCLDTCFYSLAILTVLLKLRKVLGLVCVGSFWVLEGFFRIGIWVGLLLVLWLVDLFWVFLTNREQGNNNEFIHPALWLGEYQDKAWCFRKLSMKLRATHPLWKSNLTSSLVWQGNRKCPNQRLLFSVPSMQFIQCYNVIYFKCTMICAMSWH